MNNFTIKKLIFLSFTILTLFPTGVFSQTADPKKDEDAAQIENYREQIKRLMGFLEFSLNTLGDPETTTKEKEIIINESYRKAFLHEKVQVEDDLDENRDIFTYKDVQAYLKDVDFFFKSAEFNFTIQDIQSLKNDQGMLYFKVTANRSLKGVTVEDEKISNNKTRYIEINIDDDEHVLKIASIYTTRLNETEEMISWWNGMPLPWKEVLGSEYLLSEDIRLSQVDLLNEKAFLFVHVRPEIIDADKFIYIGEDSLLIIEKDTAWVKVYDTVVFENNLSLRMLKEIVQLEILDVSGNRSLTDLYPADQMSGMKSLNISGTSITDLFPARNLTKLGSLNISGTGISDLNPIRYNTLIRELYLDSTKVSSLEPLDGFSTLEVLHLSGSQVEDLSPVRFLANLRDLRADYTLVSDLGPLADLTNLENLSFTGTRVTDLSPLEYMTTLKRLYFENTSINDLGHLTRLENLQIIDADMTQISDLGPLAGLSSLEKVFCDKTRITRQHANTFMEKHPGVLVIYESEGLNSWWSSLSNEWQSIFRDYAEMDEPPTREQLHKLTLLKQLDLEGKQSLADLTPVTVLTNLKEIYAGRTAISDLNPLSEIIDIKVASFPNTPVEDLKPLHSLIFLENLDFSHTLVTSLEGLNSLTGIQVINFDATGISDLDPLLSSREIRIIYCDDTQVNKAVVDQFVEQRPSSLVIFQTPALQSWWQGLTPAWKAAFRSHIQVDELPAREQLHAVTFLRKLDVSGNRDLTSLEPLAMLSHLEELNAGNTSINNIKPLAGLTRLRKLNISGNPVADLSPVGGMAILTQLDISNTSIAKIDILRNLTALEQLNFSGINVKKLDPLANMINLKRLECFKTGINNLKPITGLFQLKYLACYNTKLNQKKVDAFKVEMPGVEVVFY